MKKKQVLLYVNQVFLDEKSGQGSFERGLIMALCQRSQRTAGSEVVLLTVWSHDGDTPDAFPGTRTVRMRLHKDSLFGYMAHQGRLCLRLCRELWRNRAHEVVVYARYAPSMVAPALLAFLTRRRLVIRTGPVLPNLRLHRKTSNPVVCLAIKSMLGFHCRVARKIIVATQRIGQWVSDTFPYAAEKVLVVPNGVNLQAFTSIAADRERWGLPATAFVLGFIGSLVEDYGLQTVIQALAKLSQAGMPLPYLLVVGDGPKRVAWQQLAKELGVSARVVWAGSRPHHDIPSAIASCDVTLLPSTQLSLDVKGTSAVKLFEYLACDKLVLASRCDDLAFIAQHQLGQLVKADDVSAWATAIQEQMTGLLGGAQGRARSLVMQEYTFDVVAEKIWSACFE